MFRRRSGFFQHSAASRIRGFIPRLELLEERALMSVAVSDGFEGVNALDAPCCIPPNPSLAVGPDFLISAANDAMRIHDRNTGKDTVVPFHDLFAKLPQPSYYVQDFVLYDDINQRYIVAVLGGDVTQPFHNVLDLAVSDTENPFDGFTEQHQIDPTEDYGGQEYRAVELRVGGNADALLISINMYLFIPPSSARFDHVQTIAIDRQSLLDQDPSTITSYSSDYQTPFFNTVATQMHDTKPDSPIWLVSEGASTNLVLVRMDNVLSATPTFTSYTIPVQQFDINAPNADQPGSPQSIQTCRFRMTDTNWRDGQLVTAHDSRSGNVDHLRWYHIDTTGDVPVLVEEGEVNPGPDVFTYCGAVDINANDEIGITYDESSASEYMSMYVAGRSPNDPLGTLQDAVDVAPGQVNVITLSAGFHAGIGVDPNDGATFWAVDTYQPRPGSWWSWVSAFYLDNGGGAPGMAGRQLGLNLAQPLVSADATRTETRSYGLPTRLGELSAAGRQTLLQPDSALNPGDPMVGSDGTLVSLNDDFGLDYWANSL